MRYLTTTVAIFTLLVASANASASEQNVLTLEQAVSIAIENDPWLEGSQYRENAILANSVASSTLPDPVVSIGLVNLPTDGFAFDQEPMTQLKAGVSQMLPRGDSLNIRSKQLQQMAGQHPYMRKDRIAKSKVTVAFKWLEVYRAQRSIALIEQDRTLFEQLGEIAEASYSSALGNVRQQDIVRAQLELSSLDDRLTKLLSSQERAKAELLEWLNGGEIGTATSQFYLNAFTLPSTPPQIKPLPKSILRLIEKNDQQQLADYLGSHPLINSIDQRISASKTGVELAKQKYKPQWGLNASYAYRADDQLDRSRADFISVGISFDVPLFTDNKQDNEVSAAINESEAIKTDKRLALRSMLSQLQSIYAVHQRLLDRQSLYTNNILVQIREQAEVSLTAYTNYDGDFAEVVRARIADLNARIEGLNIDVDLLKSQVQLKYFFTDLNQTSVINFEDEK